MAESHTIIIDRVPTTDQIRFDPASSHWIVQALCDSKYRDPIDALHDAEVLVMILAKHVADLRL